MKTIQIICFVIFLGGSCYGQNQKEQPNFEEDQIIRCNSDEHYEQMLRDNPEYKLKREEIEKKMQEIIANRDVVDGIIIIPVVYHVIHNGDPVGSGENISDDLLYAQLDQMTDDFRRMNSDAGNTPSDFTSVAADCEIEFCLTAVDESGNAHSGINRINISTLSGVSESDCWTQSYIDNNIKIPTIWDDIDILNIWTTKKIEKLDPDCQGGILGYAQFPGMAANTDGVVLLSTTVGSIDMPNPAGGDFAIGRTGTHEVGHYLDVYHVFAGAGCGSDLVADTPTHDGPNYTGSPCTYPGPDSCDDGAGDLPDMFMNYMDYSDDECMNLFTLGQKDRMIATLNGSRSGLLTATCGTPCQDDVVISGALDGNYYADVTLTTSATTTVSSASNVELRAGSKVTLNYGFDVFYGGALFVAFGLCPDTFTSEDDDQQRSFESQMIEKDRRPESEQIHLPQRRSFTPEEIKEINEMVKRDRNTQLYQSSQNNKQRAMSPKEKLEFNEMVKRDRSIN